MNKITAKRGDIFYAELSPVVGSEQGGVRPVLIIQNNIGNYYSPTVVIAAITARYFKSKLPTHVEVKAKESKLEKNSIILLEQIRTIDKKRLKDHVTHLNEQIMEKVDKGLSLSVGLAKKEDSKKESSK